MKMIPCEPSHAAWAMPGGRKAYRAFDAEAFAGRIVAGVSGGGSFDQVKLRVDFTDGTWIEVFCGDPAEAALTTSADIEIAEDEWVRLSEAD